MTTSPQPDETGEAPASGTGGTQVEIAVADLRERLADPATEIEVVSVEEVDWPDGSLGCPIPGMMYTQAIVNGMRIVLRADGVEYAYHQGGSRDVFLCETGSAKTAPTPPPADLDL